MKCLPLVFASLASLILNGCGPSGQLARPEQNIVSRFEVEGSYRRAWQWTEAGSPAVLSLEEQGSHELLWCVREKPRVDRRRTSATSLLVSPAFPAQGPRGLEEVRFSPSGKTILIHEKSFDGARFQTLVFWQEERTGAWRYRQIDLGKRAETKLRKLDDKSRVPVTLTEAQAPKILRLDDASVVYQVDGKTASLAL